MTPRKVNTRMGYPIDAPGATLLSAAELATVRAAVALLDRKLSGTRISLVSPSAVMDWIRLQYAFLTHEVFGVLLLDNRHRLIRHVALFNGTIDGASVYPREVVKVALAESAAAVVLVHCHPSGVAEPSQADELITRRLREALALVDIRVLDHLIVGGKSIMSFSERGLL